MIYFLIALIVYLLDQISKWIVVRNIKMYETIPVIGDFFGITYIRNKGAAFSMLEGQRWFFLIITIIVSIGITWYLRKMIRSKRRMMSWALALALGGALGNFSDRAIFGEVVDFLKFHFQFAFFGKQVDYTFAIFNLADTALTIGVALIFLEGLLEWSKEKREKGYETHGS